MNMSQHNLESTAVFAELMDLLKGLDNKFIDGELAPPDEQSALAGYKWIFSILRVGLDCYLWADTQRPRFVDIVGPYKKWGGDNSDAYYQFAPVDPKRRYMVRGNKGDAVYLSLTVYGGPSDGHYSERIVDTINDRRLEIDADGNFEFMMASEKPADWDGAFVKLEDDAVVAITRDYMIHPESGCRVEWRIECLDDAPPYRMTDAELAKRLRAVIVWVQVQSAMVPLPQPKAEEANVIQTPEPVPKQTYGWAAGDAAYAMGSFVLADDEALIIDGTSPECVFWNLCLWNEFLHTYNFDYERCTINGGQAEYNEDGSWTVVVAHSDPSHPNWISPQGHRSGRIWLRWFLPEATPEPLRTRVVKLSEVAAATAR